MKKYIFRISILNSIIISYVIGLFLVIGWTMIAAISSIGEYGEFKDIAAGVVAIGFPVARLIKSKWIADIIYILMKPLEWIFLTVIYMIDVHPENRIATQYMGRKIELK